MNLGEHTLSKPTTLSREEVRSIFHRFRGSELELARDLGVVRSAVTNWLNGKPSERIGRAARLRAIELLTACAEDGRFCTACQVRQTCFEIAQQYLERRSGT